MNKSLLIKFFLPLLIIAIALSAYAYLGASKPQRKQPVASEKIWQVEVMQAVPASLSPALILYGEVETRALLKAAAPGAGQVSDVFIRPGQQVLAGQPLVTMDGRDFTLAKLQAQAEVSDIQAQLTEHELKYQANQKALEEEKKLLELANREVQRVVRLKKNNLSSASALSTARELVGRQELSLITMQLEVDRYQATKKQLQARLARARARLAETELAIERSQVRARFDGVVVEVPVAVGDRVRIADLLVSLYALDSLEISARLPARYQSEIQQALISSNPLNASATLSGQGLDLQLLRLAGEADASGIDAYFQIIKGAERLRLGNLIKMNVQRPIQHRVIAIPFRAIYGNNRIFLLREQRMQAVDVETVGQYQQTENRHLLLIRSPHIKPGDQIITTHLPNAVDGLKVKVADNS